MMVYRKLAYSLNIQVRMIDNMLAFTAEDIAALSDAQMVELLRWWQEEGDEIYEIEHARHNGVYEGPRPGVVYFARRESDGAVKIGFTTQPSQRYERLAKLLGERVQVLHEIPSDDPFQLEQEIHAQAAAWRIRGEWFALPALVLERLIRQ
jgi:hypothetical protein